MKNYQEKFEQRYPGLNLKGRAVEYLEELDGNTLLVLREGNLVGFVLSNDLSLTDTSSFIVTSPFGLFARLQTEGVLHSYPNLLLTVQRLMSVLPSSVELVVEKGRALSDNPAKFADYLDSLESFDLLECTNFFLVINLKLETLPFINNNPDFDESPFKGLSLFSEDVVFKIMEETKAMTEPMFDSWLSLRSEEELQTLYEFSTLGYYTRNLMESRDIDVETRASSHLN